ncbi:MAG: hypothetical protein AAFZ15_32970 [Bacteroidota bacterium]
MNDTSIFTVVAIGGMGKSALTWTWFNDIAPQEKQWAGRVWWSFYETDATFDSFVAKTLVYVTGKPPEAFKLLNVAEKQNALFNILDREPYLIVLDGLERILIAYARQDAAFLNDDSALDDETANKLAGDMGLPESGAKSFVGRHRLRKTTDSRIGHFLRRLSRVQASKFLISTRLYPADLQVHAGHLFPRCDVHFLPGLSDQDALELWRAYGAKGSREETLPVLKSFDKHPLLLQLLASEIAEYRSAPGDFDAWRETNPDFNVFGLPLVQVQSHVLSYALKGLSTEELQTLQVIAGFRMPVSMRTLKALLVKTDVERSITFSSLMEKVKNIFTKTEKGEEISNQIFPSRKELDQALVTLEDKGLLGWDRLSNRYDLHPIVRGVVWNNLDTDGQYEIHGSLRNHFEAMPNIKDFTKVESIEDLRPAIELFNFLIEMKLYDEAYDVYLDRLQEVTLYRLSANNLRVELLEMFFTNDIEQPPTVSSKMRQSNILNDLGIAYLYSGMPNKAMLLTERADELSRSLKKYYGQAVYLSNLSSTFLTIGQLYKTEATLKKGLMLARKHEDLYAERAILQKLGKVLSYRGKINRAIKTLELKIKFSKDVAHKQSEGKGKAFLSQVLLLDSRHQIAKELADQAWELAASRRSERDFIRAAYLQGFAAMHLNDLLTADERLHFALKKVRTAQLVEDELQVLTALAEFHRRKKEPTKAREYLDDTWDYAEEGPYPLFHADALNILAQIEIDAENKKAAIAAATKAYQKAWCDGPPYAYHYGLENARRLLKELGAPEPDLPPFDPSKFEPMPELEIDPEGLLEEGGE